MSKISCSFVTDCEVCGNSLPPAMLDLGMQPLCDDLVPVGENRKVEKFPTQISLCPVCLTAHQRYAVKKEMLFPPAYHYRARFTQDVLNGMSNLVEECEKLLGSLEGKLVCDIGCNDGSLLTIFRSKGARTVGIEPTGAAEDAKQVGHRIYNEYFTIQTAAMVKDELGEPDIITFTNVFAHIESLDEAILSISKMVGRNTVLLIENHYLGSVLQQNQFDTFYHEHPRTYSVRSFEFIAKRLGGSLIAVHFPKRYGGNIRVVISDFGGSESKSGSIDSQSIADESDFGPKLLQLQSFFDQWQSSTRQRIESMVASNGPLYGKSFPGRASILINALGLTEQLQPRVFEKPGSIKINHYIPGTRIEIISDQAWIENPELTGCMLIWAWHIGGEVAGYMRSMGYRGKLFSPLPSIHELAPAEG